jgi:hypothetical protein
MLIVGGAAALTVIALFYAWLLFQNLRARWRRRKLAARSGRHGGKHHPHS